MWSAIKCRSPANQTIKCRPVYHYSAFGLQFESQLELPELTPVKVEDRADVEIRLGEVPTQLDQADSVGIIYWAEPGRFLLSMDEVGRYLVEEGLASWSSRPVM